MSSFCLPVSDVCRGLCRPDPFLDGLEGVGSQEFEALLPGVVVGLVVPHRGHPDVAPGHDGVVDDGAPGLGLYQPLALLENDKMSIFTLITLSF